MGKNKKVKIIQDRQNCIGCGSCCIVAPEFWKMEQDNKAKLLKSKVNPKTGNYEMEVEVDDQAFAALKESENICPVQIIKIIDKD